MKVLQFIKFFFISVPLAIFLLIFATIISKIKNYNK